MAAVIYDLTDETILARLAQFHADFGQWPTTREFAGFGRWMLADVAAKLHRMTRSCLVVCEPGRVYRPRNPSTTPAEEAKPVEHVPAETPAHRTKARPGPEGIPFPPHLDLLTEVAAMIEAGDDPVAVLAQRYNCSVKTIHNHLHKVHIAVHGIHAPRPRWHPKWYKAAPAQDAIAGPVAAAEATEQGGEGIGIPQGPEEAQGASEGREPTQAEREALFCPDVLPGLSGKHDPEYESVVRFDPAKVDFAGMTETAEAPPLSAEDIVWPPEGAAVKQKHVPSWVGARGPHPLPIGEQVSVPADPMEEWRQAMSDWRKVAQDPTLREVLTALDEIADDAEFRRVVRRLLARGAA